MGNNEYLHLPQYIAVRVSPERWQIAELFGDADQSGHRPPTYQTVTKKMSTGECNNAIYALQRAASVKAKEVGG